MKVHYLVTIFTFLSTLINVSQSSEEYTISFESNGRVYIKESHQLNQQPNTEQTELIRIVPVLVNNWSGGYNTNENETEINTENANVYYDRYSSHSNWTIKATDQADKEFLVNRNNAESDALKATNNNVQFTFSINDDELCIDDFLVKPKVKQLNFINNNTKLHRIDILFLPDRKKMNNNDTKPEKGTMEDIKLYFEGFDTLNLQYQDGMLYKRSPINIESDKQMELLLNNYDGENDDFYSLYKVRNNSK